MDSHLIGIDLRGGLCVEQAVEAAAVHEVGGGSVRTKCRPGIPVST
jgi:hypothetical protein